MTGVIVISLTLAVTFPLLVLKQYDDAKRFAKYHWNRKHVLLGGAALGALQSFWLLPMFAVIWIDPGSNWLSLVAAAPGFILLLAFQFTGIAVHVPVIGKWLLAHNIAWTRYRASKLRKRAEGFAALEQAPQSGVEITELSAKGIDR